MECYISPFTGQPSVLAAALEQTYGPVVRDRIMSHIYTDQFKDEHGWPAEEDLDEQKEPSFAWVQKNIADKTSTLSFETEDDAIFAVQGTDGKGMKTGTVIEIAGKQYTVVNDTDKDIDFIPVGAPSTSTPQTVGTVVTGQTYTGNITALAPNQIFVFGSNAIGVNGNLATNKGGAALSALKSGWVKQGEKMTNRLSDSGKSWGLLTVTAPGKPLSMSRAEILSSIIIMYSAAAANPGKQFLVAYQGSAEKKNLNGYTNAQMADMFSQFKRPENVIFEKEFSTLLTEPPLQSSTPSTPVTQQPTFTIKGIEISSKQTGLGNDLTNVHYAGVDGKSKFDIKPSDSSLVLTTNAQKIWGKSVEAWYKSNNAKSKGIPEGPEGDAYDMKLMVGLIVDKLRQYPQLALEIKAKGGIEFLKNSTHSIGSGRWSSRNSKNMFITALTEAYKSIESFTATSTIKGIEPPVLSYAEGVIEANKRPSIAQNFFDGYRPNSETSKVHAIRPEIVAKYGKGVKTITLVKEGVRTRTTRLANWMKENNPKVGDYFWQLNEKNPDDKVLTRITAVYGKDDPRFKDNWFKEGWVDDNFKYVEGYDSAIEFEVVKEGTSTATSTTPVFDSLPGKSSTPTMTYAGIGSRETPAEVLTQMTEAAKYLESLGYTLNTGKTFGDKEEGADQAFSKGTIIKNLFGPEQAGDKEMKIAQELHPNWQALTAKGLGGAKLMARNTNQVFGKNLDTPVDFVLFYAQETSNPLRPKGGTGQAVEMARRKGIPTINMADADWRQQLETVLANKNKVETVPTAPTIVSLLSAEEATTFTPKNRRDIQVGYEAEMKQRFIDNIVTPAKQNPTQKFDTSDIFKNPDAFKEVDQFGLKAREWVEIVDQVRLEQGDNFPVNIRFSPTFLQAMNNSNRRTALELAERTLHEVNSRMPWSFNEGEKAKATARIEIMVSSLDGAAGQSFADKHGVERQQQIEEKMMAEFSLLYTAAGGKVKVPYLFGKILMRMKVDAITPGPLQQVWLDALQTFSYADNENKMSFLEVLIDRLAYMGYRIEQADRVQLKNYFNEKKNDPNYTAANVTSTFNLDRSDNWEQDINNYIDEMLTDMEVDDETSALMRSWQDTSFEKDAKNQASVGLKIFIGQQIQFEPFKYSVVSEPTSDSIDIDALAAVTPITLMRLGDLRKLQNKVLHSKNPDSVRASLEAAATSLPKQSNGIFPPLVDFDSLYEKVLEVLCDHPTLNFQEALVKLRATGNEDLKKLAERLEGLSNRTDKSTVDLSHFQNEFLKVMRMQYTRYYVTKAEMKKGKNGKRVSLTGKVINAQRNAQHQAIEKQWRQNQHLSPIVQLKENGERTINREKAAAHAEVIDIIATMAKKKKNDPTVWAAMSAKYEAASQLAKDIIGSTQALANILVQEWNDVKDVTAQRTELKRILAALFKEHGIEFTPEALQKLVSYRVGKDGRTNDLAFIIPKKSSLSKDFLENFGVTTQGDPAGIFSAFFRKAAKLSKAVNSDDSEETVKGALTEFNPLYSEAQTVRILASLEGTYREEVYNKVHTTLEGKQNFDYSLPTTLSQLTKDIFEGTTEYREMIRNSVWGSNPYLEIPTANKIELGYLEGLNTQKKDSGVVRKDMSDREQLMSSIILYQNNGKKTAYMLSLTHSDKTTSPVFANVPKLKALNRDGSFSTEMIAAYGAMFNSEWSRILHVQNLKKKRGTTGNKAMDTAGEKFFFFPSFNKEALGADKDLLWNEDGSIKDDLSNDELKVIQQKMIEYMTLLCDRTEEYWKKQGIDETMFDKAYKEKLAVDAEHFRSAVEDYALNSTLWNMSACALLLGDPANAEWKGSIENTLKEYSKRLAKDIAPGYQLAHEEPKYASLTIKDVDLSYDYIIASGGNIDASRATDAQEFITTEEYLKTLKAKGAIGHDLYNTLMRKVEKFDTAEEEEFTDAELEALGQPMNPMKPVYAGPRANNYDPAIIHYDYVKSSAYPLFPWLTRGKAIDHVRLLMEGKKTMGIKYARVVFESGSKMGNSSNPIQLFTKDEQFIEPTMEALAANTRVLSRRYLTIQQEVPFEAEKEEIGVVTQMDKLIVEGILKIKGFEVGLPGQTRTMDGREVRREKERVRIDMLKIAQKKLLKKLDLMDMDAVLKPEKVIELLIDSARVGEYSPNEMAMLESLFTMEVGDKEVQVSSVPIFFQSAGERFTKLLLAQVKKTVKMKMPGRSYVLGSSMGYVNDLTASQRRGIVMVPGKSLDQPLQFARKEGGKVLPAQVIAPFNFVINGVRQKITDYMTPEGTLDMDRVPAELLHLVGARIPNQGHNSMLPIEIVGFMPDWLGDLMLVPSPITGQMGSDFDVDKLYTYQRPYSKVKGADGVERLTVTTESAMRLGADEEDYQALLKHTEDILKYSGERPDKQGRYNKSVWQPAFTMAVAEKYPDGNVPRHQSELVTKKEENYQATYFNLHWAVLTHPEVYGKVASKLDKPDLGNKEAGQANFDFAPKAQPIHSYFTPTDQLQQFQSGKDAKSLVAITSLASVFDANMQDKNLRYGYYEEGIDADDAIPNPRYLRLNGLELHHISGEGLTSNGYSKHDNISIDQSGAMDNAKDRTLDNLNISVATYPAYVAMNLMHDSNGRCLDKIFMAAFSSQKILWDYTSEYRKTNDAFDEEFTKDVAAEAINTLRKKYTQLYKDSLQKGEEFNDKTLQDAVNSTDVTMDMLVKAFNEGNEEKPSTLYYVRQLAVLKAFEEAVAIGDRVGVLQKTFNQDTKGPGTDLIYILQQLENYSKLTDTRGKIFLNEDELLEGQLGETFELTVPFAYRLLSSVLPVNTIEGLFRTITLNQGKDITKIGQATKTAVMSHLRAAFVSSSPMLSMDPQITRKRLLFGTTTEKSLAMRVLALSSKVKDNFFLRRLSVELGMFENEQDDVVFLSQKSPRLIDNKIIQDFLRLIDSSDPETREVAKDLVVYAMLLTPTPTAQTFVSKLPAGVILGTCIASNLRQRYAALTQGDFPPTLLDQIYQHLPELAMKMPETAIKENNPIYKLSDRDYPEVLSISKQLNGATSPTLQNLVIGEGDRRTYTPYIKFYSTLEGKQVLYKLRNATGDAVDYVRIDILGKDGKVEYDLCDPNLKSIFAENRSGGQFSYPSTTQSTHDMVDQYTAATTDPGNAFTRWGLPETTGENGLTRALGQLSTDPVVPTYLRTLASQLAMVGFDIEKNFSQKAFQTPLRVKFGNSNDYKTSERTITLRPTANIKKSAEHLVHETVHARTSSMLHSMGWRPYSHFQKAFEGKKTKEEIDAIWQNYLKEAAKVSSRLPELYAKAAALDRLRLKALKELETRVKEKGLDIEAIKAEAESGTITSEEARVYYSLSSLIEFVPNTLSNEETIRFLNEVQSTNKKSWFENLRDMVYEFVTEVLKVLGKDFNKNSILRECLELSFELTTIKEVEQSLSPTGQLIIQKYVLENEQQARHLKDIGETVFGHAGTVTDKGTHHEVNFTDSAPAFTAPHISKALTNLQRQLEVLEAVRSNIQGKTDAARKKKAEVDLLIKEIRTGSEDIQKSGELEVLAKVAKDQLQWVEDLVKKASVPGAPVPLTMSELRMGYSIVNVWKDLQEARTYFTGSTDDRIFNIEGLARNLFDILLAQSRKTVLTTSSELTGITGTEADLGINLKDINASQAWTIGLERDTQKVSQIITTIAQYQIQNANDEKSRLFKDLKKLQDLAKKDVNFYKKLMQESETNTVWGLIQKLAPHWYQGLGEQRKKIRGSIKYARTLRPGSAKAKNIAKKVYREFWKYADSVGTVLPVGELYDMTTGARLSTPEASALLAKLRAEHTEGTVDQAMEQVDDYIQDYIQQRELTWTKIKSLEADVVYKHLLALNAPLAAVFVEEKDLIGPDKGLYAALPDDSARAAFLAVKTEELRNVLKSQNATEALRLTEEELDEQMKAWERKNSIAEFVNTRTITDPEYLLGRDNDKFWLLPKNIEENLDPKFKDMENDPTLKEAYDIVKYWSQRLKDYLPITVSRNMHANFLPAIPLHDVGEMLGLLERMKENGTMRTILEKISVGQSEIDRKNEDKIPLDYVFSPKRDAEGKILSDEMSYDLPRVLELFGDMAIQYHYAYPVQEIFQVIKTLMASQHAANVSDGKKGLDNIMRLMKYYEDMLIFKRSKDLEMVAKTPTYSLKSSTNRRIKKEVSDTKKELKAVQEEIFDIEYNHPIIGYKLPDDDPLVLKKEKLEDKLRDYEKQARYLAGSKAGDVAISIQQLKSMSYNPFSMVSNLTFGYLAARMHGRGFRAGKDGFSDGDYTNEQLSLALKLMRGNVSASLLKLFGTTGGEMAEKVRAFIHRSKAIEALIDTQYGTSNLSDDKSNLRKFIDPLAGQKSGDFLMKGAVIIARALNTPVQVLVEGAPTTINLFEATGQDGHWDKDKYGENKAWSSEDPADQKDWNKFLYRTRKTLTLVFGNQDKNMPLLLRSKLAGRLLGQFRLSWIPEGIKTRWGGLQDYDESLGRKLEGRYRTMFRMNGWGFPLLLKQVLSAFSGEDAFAGQTVKYYDEEGIEQERAMESFEMENMRRNLAGLSYSTLVLAMYFMMKASLPNEDELRKRRRMGKDGTTAQRTAINMLFRIHQDLAMYTSPDLFQQLVGNPVPAWSVVSDVLGAGKAWGKIALDEDYTWGQFWLKQTKPVPILNVVNKIDSYANKNLSTVR